MSAERKETNDVEDDENNSPHQDELDVEEQDLVQSEEESKFALIDNHICFDLYERLNAFQELAHNSTDPEEVLDARINCLSQSKLLVTIHGKSTFLLVIAHTELGEAYLALKRHQMALEHLCAAIKINGKLFQTMGETRDYHTYILNRLGQCYCDAGKYRDALSLLDKDLQMNEQLKGINDASNCEIY